MLRFVYSLWLTVMTSAVPSAQFSLLGPQLVSFFFLSLFHCTPDVFHLHFSVFLQVLLRCMFQNAPAYNFTVPPLQDPVPMVEMLPLLPNCTLINCTLQESCIKTLRCFRCSELLEKALTSGVTSVPLQAESLVFFLLF